MKGFVKGGINDLNDNIKSIQHISATIANGTKTKAVAITTIDTAKTIVMLNGPGYENNGSYPRNSMVQVTLTDATTVTFDTYDNTDDNIYVNAIVVEFWRVKSLQTLSVAQTSATIATAITEVDSDKSLLFGSFTGMGTNYKYSGSTRIYFASNTQVVTINKWYGASATAKVYVVEFD